MSLANRALSRVYARQVNRNLGGRFAARPQVADGGIVAPGLVTIEGTLQEAATAGNTAERVLLTNVGRPASAYWVAGGTGIVSRRGGSTAGSGVTGDYLTYDAFLAHVRDQEAHQQLVNAGEGIDVNEATQRVRVLLAENSGLAFDPNGDGLMLGEPGTLGVGQQNLLLHNRHYHEIETSSNPGAARAILASTENGGITLESMRVNGELNVGESAFFAGGTVRMLYHFGHGINEGDPLHRHVHMQINPRGSDVVVDEQFGVAIYDNLFVAGYMVGRHALQLPGALMICHFDGASRDDVRGDTQGHKGQTPINDNGQFVFVEPGAFEEDRCISIRNEPLLYAARNNFDIAQGGVFLYAKIEQPLTRDCYLFEASGCFLRVKRDGTLEGRWGDARVLGDYIAPRVGEWFLVGITRDAETTRVALFHNGLLIDENWDDAATTTPDSIAVGGGHGNLPAWQGLIDELFILGRTPNDDLVRAVWESGAPVFAETGNFYWRAGAGLVHADEEGLWMRDVDGNAVLGAYGASRPKSWGGVTLRQGDLLMGNDSMGYLHVSPAQGQSRARMVIEMLPGSTIPDDLLPDLPNFGDLALLDRLNVNLVDGLGGLALQDSVHIDDVVGYDPNGSSVPAANVTGLRSWLEANVFSTDVWERLTPGEPGSWLDNSGLIVLEKMVQDTDLAWLRGTQVNSQGLITMDTILDGSTYARLRRSSLTPEGLLILDAIEDGPNYAKVSSSLVKAGLIELGEYTNVGGQEQLSGWRMNPTTFTGYSGGVPFGSLSRHGVDFVAYAGTGGQASDNLRAITYWPSLDDVGSNDWVARAIGWRSNGRPAYNIEVNGNGGTSALNLLRQFGQGELWLFGVRFVHLGGAAQLTCGSAQVFGNVLADSFGSEWIALTPGNGWTNYGNGWPPLAYRIVGQRIELRGRIQATTDYASNARLAGVPSPVFVQHIKPTRWGSSFGTVQVNVETDGDLTIQASGIANHSVDLSDTSYWLD